MTDEDRLKQAVEDPGGRYYIFEDGHLAISLSNSRITDETMSVFSATRYERLNRVNLSFCPITDYGIARLSKQDQIEELDLRCTLLTGRCLRDLSFPALRHLRIDGCTRFEASCIPYLSQYHQLEELILNSVSIDDNALTTVGRLSSLRKLYLKGTGVTDDGIMSLSALKHLKHLDLDKTQTTREGYLRLKELLPHLVDAIVF